jgi:hypothetical protein
MKLLGQLRDTATFYGDYTNEGTWEELNVAYNTVATGWTVRGSNSGGGDIFRIRPDRP